MKDLEEEKRVKLAKEARKHLVKRMKNKEEGETIMNLGELVYRKRTQQGLSIGELAIQLNLKDGALTKFERGENKNEFTYWKLWSWYNTSR